MNLDETKFNEYFDEAWGKSIKEFNKDLKAEAFYLDEVENAIDSLETAVAFLDRQDNLKWKWVSIALHHSLYSFCISCLVGTNYENVLSNDKNEEDKRYCRQGDDTKWKKSRRVMRPNNKGYTIEWSYTDENPPSDVNKEKSKKSSKNLIGFWTALARVQDQTFWMGRSRRTRALSLKEDEWKSIEWLTNNIRNGCVHFMPMSLAVLIPDVKKASLDIIRVINFLSLQSCAIVYSNPEEAQKRIETAITALRSKIG